MAYNPSNQTQNEVAQREHDSKGVGAKKTTLYGYDVNSDELARLAVVDNGDGTFSLKVSSNAPVGGATEAEQLSQTEILEQLTVVLKNLMQSIVDPVTLDRSLNRTRHTAIVESGTITTVSTVTGVTNIDSYQGKLLMLGQDVSAWANTVRARIT